MKILGKFGNLIDTFGPVDGILYAIDSMLSRLPGDIRLINYDIVVQPVPANEIISITACRNFSIRKIIRASSDLQRMPVPKETIESRFEQGAVCLGIYRDDQCVGYAWLCFRSYREDEIRVDYLLPNDSSAFDFDIYIFPEHRFGRAFACLWQGINSYLRFEKIRYTFSRITRFNLQSKSSHKSLGAKAIGRIIALRIWRFEIIFSSAAPRVQLLLKRTSRGIFQIPDSNL